MTAIGDFLNQVVPTLVRVARRPGELLLRWAAAEIGVFALFGLLLGLTGTGGSAWVPLVLAGFLAVPVVVLAVRRERLQAQTQGLELHRTISANGTSLVTYGARPSSGGPPQEELDTLNGALAEGALRTARYFPRIEAAQRAGVRAAGGVVNAPYLRDDLRVTFVALLGTLAAIPLAALGVVITLVLLLSS
ncbi:hypothetical protein [Pengzhenrongella sp.]|jgi:hypothetical protein|uniref:hypothetical protein n=1 Tax=Pengzhenrongella sp. TaxID=2888820 RepID=UPI002F958454